MQGSITGYIYLIRDPFILQEKNGIYIGNSFQPWKAVEGHLLNSSNIKVASWASETIKKCEGRNIEILGQEVCDIYHGESIIIPPVPPNTIRIEWEILGYQEDYTGADLTEEEWRAVKANGPLKYQLIRQLKSEGHPLLNGLPGRPSTYSKKYSEGVNPKSYDELVKEVKSLTEKLKRLEEKVDNLLYPPITILK